MGTIEQRISDAIDDLRTELSQGVEVQDALLQVAADYDLHPEALRKRSVQALGLLEEVAEREAKSSQRASIEARMKHAIFEYARLDEMEPVAQWLQAHGGREPTPEEIQEADWQWILRHIKIEI